jgi:hypothetical protein
LKHPDFYRQAQGTTQCAPGSRPVSPIATHATKRQKTQPLRDLAGIATLLNTDTGKAGQLVRAMRDTYLCQRFQFIVRRCALRKLAGLPHSPTKEQAGCTTCLHD